MKNPISIAITVIYSCLFAIMLIGQFIESFGFPLVIATGIRLFLLIILSGAYFYLWKQNSLFFPSGYSKIFILIFFCYIITIILRGEWEFSAKYILSHVVDTYSTLIYLLPLILMPLPNRRHLMSILRVAFFFSLLTIPLWLLNIDKLFLVGRVNSYKVEGIGMWLPFLSAFLLPMWGVLNKGERVLNFSIFLAYFILMLINARRNVCLSFAFFSIISLIAISRSLIRGRHISNEAIVVVVLLLGLSTIVSIKPLLNGPFSYLQERVKEDTRSGVEASFIADMYTSSVSDWIFGRGMDGRYEQFVTDSETGDVDDSRQIIETGYLNIILKGGAVYLAFILFFLIRAIIVFFRNGTRTQIYLACILLVYIIDLYTTNPVCVFNPRSILFWLLVSYSFQSSR